MFDPATGAMDPGAAKQWHASWGIRDYNSDPKTGGLAWSAKLVAYTLLARAKWLPHEERWEAHPSLALTAADCGISVSSVQRGLDALRALRLVSWAAKEDSDVNSYTIDCDAMYALPKRPKVARNRGGRPRKVRL